MEVPVKIDISLEKNIAYLEAVLSDSTDIIKRSLWVGDNKYWIYMVYMDSMIDRMLVEGKILKNLMYDLKTVPEDRGIEFLKDNGINTADATVTDSMEDALKNMFSGDTLIFGNHCDKVLVINSKGYPNRGVPTAESEVAIRGSKESFSEVIRVNTILIRRRIRDTRLKVKQMSVGVRSKTDVAIVYMDDLVRKDILKEIEKRLKKFEIDGIFDSGSLEQLVEEKWYSPFPQFQSTERPDKVSSAILEGRIALIIDNSPMVLLLPTTLNCFFQASDDYYNRWGAVCFTRILRYLAAIVSVVLPGIYVAIATFHPEIFPTKLALSFVASRQGVPFPLAIEVLLMELAFELLREAGIRLPGPMGGTLGIVGGLIIGQAAVDANIISPTVVIVVALTALSAFTIPNEGFASAFRLVKFYMLLLSSFLGLVGFVLGGITILVHLASLKSFNIPYLMPFVASNMNDREDEKDSIIRFPIFSMKNRPVFTRREARRRINKKNN